MPSTCYIPTLVGDMAGAGQGSPLRVASGVPLGMGGDPEPCTVDTGQHTSVQGAVSYISDTASSSTTARPCGRDGNSCWCRSGHSPLNVATELVVSLETTTVHRAAGCVCRDAVYVCKEKWAVVYRGVDGEESRTECAIVLCTHALEIEECERNMLSGSRVHSTLKLSQIRSASPG